jgi:hypothetical protein
MQSEADLGQRSLIHESGILDHNQPGLEAVQEQAGLEVDVDPGKELYSEKEDTNVETGQLQHEVLVDFTARRQRVWLMGCIMILAVALVVVTSVLGAKLSTVLSILSTP